ncbi:MAG: hypothetical protein J2P17_28895 [Mycobacterium sp.]|nr:hypothetical protein [Mycobacterium sp.]
MTDRRLAGQPTTVSKFRTIPLTLGDLATSEYISDVDLGVPQSQSRVIVQPGA